MLRWLKSKLAEGRSHAALRAARCPDPRLDAAEAYLDAGNAPRAAALLREVSEQSAASEDRAKALARLADLLQNEGRLAEAKKALEQALRDCPDDADLNYRVGVHCLMEHDPEQALDFFHLALHYRGNLYPACAGRAQALKALGRASDWPQAFRDFLASNPGHLEATLELAGWHYGQAEFDKAVELLEPLVSDERPDRRVDNLLGLAIGRELGDFDRAETLLRRALAADSDWIPALCNLGWMLLEQGRYPEGLACIDRVLELNPEDAEARLTRACMNLKRGEFAVGWRDYDSRHKSALAVPRPYTFERWRGESIPGKTLLIYGEQGIGDQLMFASCFPEALECVGRAIIECNPKLTALFARSFPDAKVQENVPAGQEPAWLVQAGPIDFQVAMGDLPGMFRTRLEDFPMHSGYLRADPERVAYWRARLGALGAGMKVGLSWRGGAAATRRQLRSVALADLAPLLDLPLKAVSLQYGPVSEDLERLREETGRVLPHWQEAIDDYEETAALICALDLVVSVCTAVIHLSGALGQKVWVLTPATPEWRYMNRGENLPWYPSARLFRQTRAWDWAPVIAELGRALGLEARRATPPG